MGKLKKTIKKFEMDMTAAAFAEAGEFEAAREVLKEERRVLLALRENQIDNNTLKYVVNTCKRTGAKLDILYISASEKIQPIFEQYLKDLEKEGIHFRLVQRKGCLKQQIIDYVNSKKEIIFAVTGSSDKLDVACKGTDGKLSEAWQHLKCPLVVVEDNA